MALEWLPSYPAWLGLPHRRPWLDGIDARAGISPLPNALPPTELTWQPTYTDRADGARRVVTLRTYAIKPLLPPTTVSWLPRYPEQIRRLWLHVSRQAFTAFQIGGILDVPIRGSWRPSYPAWLVYQSPVPTGQQIWLADATTLLNAILCLTWEDGEFRTSRLQDERVQSPAVDSEALVSSTFIEEDLC